MVQKETPFPRNFLGSYVSASFKQLRRNPTAVVTAHLTHGPAGLMELVEGQGYMHGNVVVYTLFIWTCQVSSHGLCSLEQHRTVEKDLCMGVTHSPTFPCVPKNTWGTWSEGSCVHTKGLGQEWMGKVSLNQVSCGLTVVACTLEVGGLLLKSISRWGSV